MTSLFYISSSFLRPELSDSWLPLQTTWPDSPAHCITAQHFSDSYVVVTPARRKTSRQLHLTHLHISSMYFT